MTEGDTSAVVPVEMRNNTEKRSNKWIKELTFHPHPNIPHSVVSRFHSFIIAPFRAQHRGITISLPSPASEVAICFYVQTVDNIAFAHAVAASNAFKRFCFDERLRAHTSLSPSFHMSFRIS